MPTAIPFAGIDCEDEYSSNRKEFSCGYGGSLREGFDQTRDIEEKNKRTKELLSLRHQ